MVADPNRRVVPPSPAWSWLSALVPPSSRPQHSSPSPSALDTDIAYCPFRFPSARRHASRHPHSGLDALSKTWTTFDSSADRRVSRPSHVKRNDMRRSPQQRYRYMYRLPRRVKNYCPQLGLLDVKKNSSHSKPTCTALPPVEIVRIARSLLAWNPATPWPPLLASWRRACPKEQLKRRRRASQVKSNEIFCLQLCWIRDKKCNLCTSSRIGLAIGDANLLSREPPS
ncbi:hypothetical protein IWX90DRAFT_322180 [Phyllosticta citrichinensis]|uniref:Uncharacterized protein n=1 Tax=Phyllosticta citrichinensis TaxID=1130410 RepID=A0ABR1XJQ1_9PEZI